MKKIAITAFWEFRRFILHMRFWVYTLIVPVAAAAVLLLPTYYYQHQQQDGNQVIGCVSLDTTDICQQLSNRLVLDWDTPDINQNILLEPIPPDTTEMLQMDMLELQALKSAWDSLQAAYQTIQKRREYLFGRPESGTKNRLLKESYDELIATREQLDITAESYADLKSRVETSLQEQTIRKADSLLAENRIGGYLLIKPDQFANGIVEYYTRMPRATGNLQVLEHALQVVLVEQRMRQFNFQPEQIYDVLHPVVIQEFVPEAVADYTFTVREIYLYPGFALLLLLLSLITSGGFVGTSVFFDQKNRLGELWQFDAGRTILLIGKFTGLWLLGAFQLILWGTAVYFFISLRLLNSFALPFFTWQFVQWLFAAFSIAFWMVAGWYAVAAMLSKDRSQWQQLTLCVHGLVLLPLLVSPYLLMAPGGLVARFLSFLPPFTPTFFLFRVVFATPPQIDFIIAGVIMFLVISISLMMLVRFQSGAIIELAKPHIWHRFTAMWQLR